MTRGGNRSYIEQKLNKSFDSASLSINVIDYSHHEIHEGDHYTFTHVATAAGGGGTYTIRLVTPDTTKWSHFLASVLSDQPYTLVLREGSTFSADGDAGAEINNNRNSSNVAGTVITYGATVDVAGTVLYTYRTGSRSMASETRSDNEFILKQNTAYDLTVTNHTVGTDANISFILNWYEHTNRNW